MYLLSDFHSYLRLTQNTESCLQVIISHVRLDAENLEAKKPWQFFHWLCWIHERKNSGKAYSNGECIFIFKLSPYEFAYITGLTLLYFRHKFSASKLITLHRVRKCFFVLIISKNYSSKKLWLWTKSRYRALWQVFVRWSGFKKTVSCKAAAMLDT
jgi:hypothetical protein